MIKTEEKQRVIDLICMPWLEMSGDEFIGDVHFIPVKKFLDSCDDPQIEKRVKEVFGCYVDEIHEPVKTGVICQLAGKPELPKLSDSEISQVRRAVDALCFAAIYQLACSEIGYNNYQHYCSTALFELIQHRSTPQQEHFSHTKRRVTIINCSYDHKFHRPEGLLNTRPCFNDEIIDALSKLQSPDNIKLQERVFRSLEWVRFAHSDSEEVSEGAKIVMMGTAFEILLHITDRRNKKRQLMNRLDKLCRSFVSAMEFRKLDEEKVEFSRIAWWMHDFYNLRNDIVHGGQLDDAKFCVEQPDDKFEYGVNHLQVATVVIGECIWRLLCEKKIVGNKCRAYSRFFMRFKDSLTFHDMVKRNALIYTGSERVHKMLGWMKAHDDYDEEDE